LINANNTRSPAAWIALAVLALAAMAQQRTSEITSNEIWRCAGSNDTLWLATSKGLNFTTHSTADTLRWQGFTGITAWALAFGNGTAVVCKSAGDSRLNALWTYTHASDAVKEITPQYPYDKTFKVRNSKDTILPHFLAGDAVWSARSFWIAYGDGGLLKMDAGQTISVFYPGYNKKAFSPSGFNPDTAFDTTRSVITVAADDSGCVWTGCNGTLWRFDTRDTTWSRINDDSILAPAYLDLTVRGGGIAASVFAIAVSRSSAAPDTGVFVFRASTGTWRRFILDKYHPSDVVSAPGGRLYILHDGGINLYRDTLADDKLPQSAPAIDGETFKLKRFPLTLDYPTINSLLYLTHAGDTLLWVSTAEGLFYSKSEHRDEDTVAATGKPRTFRRIVREKALGGGLQEVYAYPSILNDSYGGQRAIFAYNLDKDDNVTIDIYDFNMDHVVRIIDNQLRYAGTTRTDGSGRSTDPTRDSWDGTFSNDGGAPVAAGVYYFQIKTKNGPRAFGKIIVAKSGR
jgi:hypothetical protein